jgi:NMD protein affecting ribosome stability and mRNA decay
MTKTEGNGGHKLILPRYNYFQGILQLRDANEEIMAYVKNQLGKRQDVAVTKIVKHKNGTDLYITSQQFIRSVAKKLKDNFGGELKISSQLHTKSKTGKDLYRVNAFFRPSRFRAGDVVPVRGDDIKILRVGNRIFGRDMKTGKKLKIRREDLPR